MKNKPSFRSHAIRGFSWIAGVKVAEKIVSVARTVILARLLTPNDFGMFGLALITLSLFETFTETGISEALVQKTTKAETDLPTVWIILAIRGLLLSSLIILASSFIARFFNLPEPGLIALVGITPLIRGLSNPATILWRKHLEFGKDVIYRFSSSFLESIISVILVFITRSVWSLPIAFVLAATIQSVASYIFAPIHWGKFKKTSFNFLFKFGRWMNLNSIIYYLSNQGDDWVVGKLLNTYSLGLYQTAFRVAMLPASQFGGAVSVIGFPLLAAQKTHEVRMKRTIKLAWSAAYPSFILGGAILLFAPQIVELLLGSDWLPMVTALRLLIIFGTLTSITGILGKYYISKGQPNTVTFLSFLRLLTIAIVIVPAVKLWGISGAALAIIFPIFTITPLYIKLLKKEPGINEIRIIKPPFTVFLITLLLGLIIKSLLPTTILGLFINLSLYTLTFALLAYLLDPLLRDLLIQEVLPRFKKR